MMNSLIDYCFLCFTLHYFWKNLNQKLIKKKSQELFDFFVRQIELSIREIGYGDVSVNKKMKEYVNMFYAILDKIEVTDMSIDENIANFFRKIFNLDKNIKFYANYYKKYNEYLSNNTLNNFTKDIINHNF